MSAILFVSYGAPETPDDILPFLREVLAAGGAPAATCDEGLLTRFAHPYHELAQCTGRPSPLLDACRHLLGGLESRLNRPLFWGNLFGTPRLVDAIEEMIDEGITSCVVVTTSPFASSVGCQRYRERIVAASAEGHSALTIEFVAPYGTHPIFVRGVANLLEAAVQRAQRDRNTIEVVFTAHSLPLSDPSATSYAAHVGAAVCAVMNHIKQKNGGTTIPHRLLWQSRSRLRQGDWLGPELRDWLAEPATSFPESTSLVVVPIGFLCENKETVYDLDVEAASLCEDRGWGFDRVATLGSTPAVVELLASLVTDAPCCASRCGPACFESDQESRFLKSS